MTSTQATVEAVRKTVTVKCGIDHAFRTFTEGIGGWWPLHSHAVSLGEGSGPPETVVMEPRAGGRLYERTRDGRECEWGSVLEWEPPARLVPRVAGQPGHPVNRGRGAVHTGG